MSKPDLKILSERLISHDYTNRAEKPKRGIKEELQLHFFPVGKRPSASPARWMPPQRDTLEKNVLRFIFFLFASRSHIKKNKN